MAAQTGKRSTQMSPATVTVAGMRVCPNSRSFVVPSIPTKEHWLPLSNLDRVVNPTFSSVILFYESRLTTDQSFQDVIRSLKASLARVLADFYPMAGRLALQEDGLVDLHCNDEGAIFIEASVDAQLSAIGGAQPMPALSGLGLARLGPGPTYIPDQLTSMPVLVIMVTRFKCGSIAIAVNWHHTVADATSGCHFMKSWAEVATGTTLSLAPYYDRSPLKPRNPLNDSLINGYSTRNLEELELYNSGSGESGLPVEPTMLNSFHISKAAMEELKEVVSRGSGDEKGSQFTSAEVVSALLWRQMTKARAGDQGMRQDRPEMHSVTRFFMFVNGRKKLNLPAGYFGNVVCSACAVAREEDILNKPLWYAASLIRKATRSASADYFRSLIDWVEVQGKGHAAKSDHVNSLGNDVAATFWTFLPLYEMDFGWGKPDLAARNSPARPLIDGIAMMPSAKGAGDLVALLNLHADRMDRLSRQASFKAIFS